MAEEPDLVVSAGFSDAQLVREADKVVAFYKRKGEEAQKAFVDAQGRVTNTQAAKAHMRELDNLSKAYDPAYRAARQYEAEVKRLDRALDLGAINQKQYTAEVERAARQMRDAGNAAEELRRKGVQGGTGWNNVGLQIGDVAVQMGAGTSAAQALGQQLPQLLSGFGTLGIMMGTASAIAIPLGSALLKVAMDTETLDDKLESLEKTTGAYVDAVEAAGTPLDELRKKYGDLADEIQRVNDVTALVSGAQAKIDLLGTANKLGQILIPKTSGDASIAGFGAAAGVEVNPAQSGFDRLTDIMQAYKVTREEAERLQMAFNRLASSNSQDAVIKDAQNLQAILIEVAGSAEEAGQRFPVAMNAARDLIQSAADQIAAADRAHREAQQDLLDTYDANTQKLKKLANDRAAAEKMLAEAVKDGNQERIASSKEVLRQIDRELDKTRQLARESDAAYQKMARGYKEYADSRRAGQAWAQSASGFEAEYVASRARGSGSEDEELVRAVTALSEQMGIAAKDLLAVMSFETGGKLRPNVIGPTTSQGQHFGLIQFGDKGAGPRYGVTPDSSITEQVVAAGRYLQDAGVKAGDSLANIYAAVLAGDARKVFASDLAAGGVVGNVTEATGGDQFEVHKARAEGLLAAYGSVEDAAKKSHAEEKKRLQDEIRERERLAKRVKEYGEDLSKNLLSEQKQAELAKQQADQIAAIKASDLGAKEQATAIAAVNAEIEKQRLVYTLLEEAKRRQVDLDAMLTDGTMTYRQAIEALGEQKRQQIIVDEQRAQAEQKAAERAEFAAQAQETLKDGLLDAIVAGESFADVLANVAQMLARAALQAALFGEGPFASGGSGGGLLGSLFGAFGFGGQQVTGNDALSNALRGISGFRANGGSVQSGKVYGVGEQGPELFVPSVSGAILNVAQAQAALRGGQSGGSFSFNPTINVGGNVTQDDIARIHQVMDVERKNFIQNVRRAQAEIGQRYS
ncbi:coiled-coil domain-containing protein [Paracoccus yeei]|uniref:Bacteriophage tail tape measure N-terminal domain-containing protein n=1 Tax=Paracoccus yeei TaxID=147645 RepID=A0A5P2QT69_9RHOB|nr:hypothetical protein [Paracoccus yeei]QEU08773.1 hypothetical protein FOB51_12645 [Paracoccus yeei]